MKIAYIAHPIGGNVIENLEKIRDIGRMINIIEPKVVPFAPYFLDCHCLNDSDPKERARGIKNDRALFERGFIDEVRLYGSHISNGMRAEIELAHKLGIPVKPMNTIVLKEYEEIQVHNDQAG